MLLRAIRAESLKLRHSPVWLVFLILPILPALMGTFNYLQNIALLQSEWYSLWTQHTLFTCYFFLPATIGVYCSYLYRMEHTNYNWNAVMTAPVPVYTLYTAKLLAASAMVLLTQLWVGALYFISGKLIGLDNGYPPELFEWLAFGTLAAIAIAAVQLCLSLVIRSFSIPVGIALVGGILGLSALAKGYGIWFPYSLLAMGMQANNPAEEILYSPGLFIANCLLFVILCTLFAAVWSKKRDVMAE